MEMFGLVFSVFIHLLRVYIRIMAIGISMSILIVGLAILSYLFKKDSQKVTVLFTVLGVLLVTMVVVSLLLLF